MPFLFEHKIFVPAFEGEGSGSGDDGGSGDGAGGSGDGAGSGGAGAGDGGGDAGAVVEQHKKVIEQLTSELAALQKRSNLSSKDRQAMETRIDDLNNQLLTKEELASKEKNKLLKQLETERESLSQEAEAWRNRYEETTIVGGLTEAAAKANAYNPKQIVTMLRGETHLAEILDGDQPTGQFEVVVTLDTVNDKGEPVKLTLKPDEAVKHMAEQEDYLNLFKSDDRGGFGGGPTHKRGQTDAATLARDPKAYREARRKGQI